MTCGRPVGIIRLCALESCGKPFRISNSKQRYCSQTHRSKHWRHQHRAKNEQRVKKFQKSPNGRAWIRDYGVWYYSRPEKKLNNLCNNARRRALKRGLPYDTALPAILISDPPTNCVACGRPLDYSAGRGPSPHNSPSLDRLDNNCGYTLDNVRVVCWRCNNVKGDSSVEKLEMIVRYIKHNLDTPIDSQASISSHRNHSQDILDSTILPLSGTGHAETQSEEPKQMEITPE